MPTVGKKRFSDALAIQMGASNPSGIIHTMLAACQEIMSDPDFKGTEMVKKDPALRLMTHQLADLMNINFAFTDPLDTANDSYSDCMEQCAVALGSYAEASKYSAGDWYRNGLKKKRK